MQTIGLALTKFEGKARKIDIPFRQVSELVDYWTQDLAVLAGAPGGGKSLTALNWAWRSTDPILYLAQDSPRSVLKRLTALALNENVGDIREEDADYWAGKMIALGQREELVIATGSHTIDMIDEKIVALTEWLMEPPKLIVIDNLFDLKSEAGNYTENAFYGEVLPTLKQLAIKRDVGIMILHHVTRSGDSGKKHGLGTERLRLTDLLFAGEREARHVWAVYQGFNGDSIKFQILKQQDGEANPEGYLQVSLDWKKREGRLWSR